MKEIIKRFKAMDTQKQGEVIKELWELWTNKEKEIIDDLVKREPSSNRNNPKR